MASSYERINYGLRPAKNIVRKMLADTFRKLSDFSALATYRYIGFGSTYFSDFILFHKELGITNMFSIEHDTSNEERFRFNCPYSCIEILFGESGDILPSLPWGEIKTILWLDYDSRLTKSVLEDVAYFCVNAVSGSVLVVTVNSQPDTLDPTTLEPDNRFPNDLARHRLEKLVEDVGEDKIPVDVAGSDLASWGKAELYRRIIVNEIKEHLSTRNGGRPRDNPLSFMHLLNIWYADGDKMLTVGGLLYEEGQSHIVSHCNFEELSYIHDEEAEPYFIEVPALTYKELRYLDSLLPTTNPDEFEAPPIPRSDTRKYARIYRYFPTFAEAEV